MSWEICAVFLFSCCSLCLGQESYPEVKQIERTFEVMSVKNADVSLRIEAPNGKPLYNLQCHTARYVGDRSFDYSGDFECRFTVLYKPTTYSTLLTEDEHQSRDWESRGRFFASDLEGACAKIPQFGSVRSFRLRAMELTLRISNATFAGKKLKSLNLVVGVRPDKTAKTPIAEPVPFPTVVPTSCKLREHFVDSSRQ